MRHRLSCLAALAACASLAATSADATCTGQLTVNGRMHALSHCTLAVMPGDNTSVTLLASADPITADEASGFALSAYSPLTQKNGTPRSGLVLSFCAGGKSADPGAARRFQTSISVQSEPLLGRERALPDAQGQVRIVRLTGTLERGGTLAGALEGRLSDSDRYAFRLEWSLPIPAQDAASGISCP
jgi:hypothetical protein